jgi:hypothetical protein
MLPSFCEGLARRSESDFAVTGPDCRGARRRECRPEASACGSGDVSSWCRRCSGNRHRLVRRPPRPAGSQRLPSERDRLPVSVNSFQAGDEGSIPFTRAPVRAHLTRSELTFGSYTPVVICRRLVAPFNLPRSCRGPSSSGRQDGMNPPEARCERGGSSHGPRVGEASGSAEPRLNRSV